MSGIRALEVDLHSSPYILVGYEGLCVCVCVCVTGMCVNVCIRVSMCIFFSTFPLFVDSIARLLG